MARFFYNVHWSYFLLQRFSGFKINKFGGEAEYLNLTHFRNCFALQEFLYLFSVTFRNLKLGELSFLPKFLWAAHFNRRSFTVILAVWCSLESSIHCSFIHVVFKMSVCLWVSSVTSDGSINMIYASWCRICVITTFQMGTSLATLFSYVSQSSITQIFAFVVVVFIYGPLFDIFCFIVFHLASSSNGYYDCVVVLRLVQLGCWRTIDAFFNWNLCIVVPLFNWSNKSTLYRLSFVDRAGFVSGLYFGTFVFDYVYEQKSEIFDLQSKFASVFDLLMSGKDVVKHIESGTHFLTGSLFINHLIGYTIMFGPITIVAAFALFAFYKTALVYKMVSMRRVLLLLFFFLFILISYMNFSL